MQSSTEIIQIRFERHRHNNSETSWINVGGSNSERMNSLRRVLTFSHSCPRYGIATSVVAWPITYFYPRHSQHIAHWPVQSGLLLSWWSRLTHAQWVPMLAGTLLWAGIPYAYRLSERDLPAQHWSKLVHWLFTRILLWSLWGWVSLCLIPFFTDLGKCQGNNYKVLLEAYS